MKGLGTILPESALRKEKPRLAEVDEPTVIRHYTNLARENEGIDTTFYPLGSCTMKHNPRANEAAAVVPGFAGLHPLQPEAQVQGALRSCTNYRASSPRSPGCLTLLAASRRGAGGADKHPDGQEVLRRCR